MNLRELIEKLKASVPALRQRANTALAGLPALESLEVGAEVSTALRALSFLGEELTEVEARLGELLPAVEAESTALVAATQSKLLEDGTHVATTDRDAQVAEAKKAGKLEAETEFKAAETAKAAVAAARKAAEDKVGAKAAAALADADLTERAEIVTGKMAERIATMKAAGITEETTEAAFGELVSVGFDEAGEVTFNARLKSYESFAEALKKPSTAPTGPASFRASAPPAGQGSTEAPSNFGSLRMLV